MDIECGYDDVFAALPGRESGDSILTVSATRVRSGSHLHSWRAAFLPATGPFIHNTLSNPAFHAYAWLIKTLTDGGMWHGGTQRSRSGELA